jgi:hypothetical protein
MLCEWHLKAQALSARTKAKNTVFQFEHVTQMYRNRGIRYPIYFRDSDQPNLYILLYTDVFRKIPRSENSERRCPPFFKPIVPVPLSRSSRSRHPIEGSVTGLHPPVNDAKVTNFPLTQRAYTDINMKEVTTDKYNIGSEGQKQTCPRKMMKMF